jgi:hypothetical protein
MDIQFTVMHKRNITPPPPPPLSALVLPRREGFWFCHCLLFSMTSCANVLCDPCRQSAWSQLTTDRPPRTCWPPSGCWPGPSTGSSPSSPWPLSGASDVTSTRHDPVYDFSTLVKAFDFSFSYRKYVWKCAHCVIFYCPFTYLKC